MRDFRRSRKNSVEIAPSKLGRFVLNHMRESDDALLHGLISFRTDPEIHEALIETAKALGIDTSALLNMMIRDTLPAYVARVNLAQNKVVAAAEAMLDEADKLDAFFGNKSKSPEVLQQMQAISNELRAKVKAFKAMLAEDAVAKSIWKRIVGTPSAQERLLQTKFKAWLMYSVKEKALPDIAQELGVTEDDVKKLAKGFDKAMQRLNKKGTQP